MVLDFFKNSFFLLFNFYEYPFKKVMTATFNESLLNARYWAKCFVFSFLLIDSS